ncbi:Si-specific NAD(P)(+) transhydrogenase [Abyssibacter profundi]|uniref:Soluble pyridine nucleotide transhydrogenase n=1 Tax=Abyssibacter profundi TaxID=2182787 RepID=A0A363UN65_9GAMM|nr:Si-specific NAD(P)(+) transhydrogenase [Abyssibacter profundi]MBV61155.1 Si-specific NAD(P)(+) transhydrogenase [Nevskiales bacterium]PWN56869.1 Si-specific NAD(P)(+) transhydrogenase [Abyssibacter profundi]
MAKRNPHYDVIVIGSGPGGEGAAMMAAKNRRSVAVIERYVDVGGGCTHWGTIPSKALRHAARRYSEIRREPLYQEFRKHLHLTYPEILRTADSVIARQTSLRRAYYERNHVPLIEGTARLTGPNSVEVTAPGAQAQTLTADAIILSTGSRPYRPPELDFSHPRIRDSDTILQCEEHPRSITIYGAGVIGSEYASIFSHLGIRVNLVNTQSRLLSYMDDEITEALSYHLRDRGVTIRHNEKMARVEPRDHDVVLHLESGRRIKSDYLLWANGRTGNTDSLNLAAVGLEADGRGQLKVNEHHQTEVPSIYAVGDVIGFPALASSAYDQGRFAAAHIVAGEARSLRFDLMPTGIYTIPEISSVGKTERELAETGVPYEIGHAFFKHLARAQMVREEVGMLKLIFHAETLEILGIHCFGEAASEIVHIGQTVMARGGERQLQHFIDTTFNYPTMAEAYRVAALNGMNRLV